MDRSLKIDLLKALQLDLQVCKPWQDDDVISGIELIISGLIDTSRQINCIDKTLLKCAFCHSTVQAIILADNIDDVFSNKTLLMSAAQYGYFNLAKTLISHGADIDKVVNNNTALDWAYYSRHCSIKTLLSRDSNCAVI